MSSLDDDVRRDLAQIEADGFVLLPRLLSPAGVAEIRAVLEPQLRDGAYGRNEFEGKRTQRVYSLVGHGKPFADLVEHPRILALCDALLAPGYLLTASQAICIYPGETPQSLHTDDTFYSIPRPRPAVSVSTIVAIDDFTAANGCTRVVPGSHRWSDAELAELLPPLTRAFESGRDPDAVEIRGEAEALPRHVAGKLADVVMPSGSVVFFLGTLVHGGGANRSAGRRLALSNQYCEPWARQQECYLLSIPRDAARAMSPRVQQLLGYSIHPPFMGHVRGRHPVRLLED